MKGTPGLGSTAQAVLLVPVQQLYRARCQQLSKRGMRAGLCNKLKQRSSPRQRLGLEPLLPMCYHIFTPARFPSTPGSGASSSNASMSDSKHDDT